MESKPEFRGRTVVVTGAASGIGQALAVAYGQAGANVVLADVNGKNGERNAETIRSDGGAAAFVLADVRQEADVIRLMNEAAAAFGSIHVLINNAGVSRFKNLYELSTAEWDDIVAIHLRGTFMCSREAARRMREHGGAIVNIASTNSFRPLPKQAVYTATKHGVIGLTKTAAIEYAGSGIRVNAVAPGAIDTPMLRGAMTARGSAEQDVLARLSLIGRFGQPAEIANAVLWLCSDQSTYTMGHVLAVDGGYLAR